MREPFVIRAVTEPGEYEIAVTLCREFNAWVRIRFADHLWLIDTYYPDEAWEALLAELPARHAPPGGAILLAAEASASPDALQDADVLGCIMMQRHEDMICEMKRLYVRDTARGRGVARTLCLELMALAARSGYRTMRLETGTLQPEAQALYRKLGFRERAHYQPMPQDMEPFVVSMEYDLA